MSGAPAPAAERLPVHACIRTHEEAARIFARWPRDGRVLEVAAGSGAFARRLVGLGFTVEACDLYPEDFRVPEVRCSYADLSDRLPYPDASFEYLSCLEGIEHLEDQFTFVRECARVLKPGGRLLLSTPNVLGLASRWRYFWTGFFPLAVRPIVEHRRSPVHDHIHLITYHQLRYILRTTGLTVEGVTTDRIRKYGMLLAWAWPGVQIATRRVLAAEPDPLQRQANRQIADHMLSPALLFGRTLLLTARKSA
jgi:2-polyprenyl-3-methyl-5-hydroxy-6-metoxy-1,4-benzoquinol methylase